MKNTHVMTMEQLYNYFEDDRAHRKGTEQRELHQVTARIDSTAQETLLKLSERWDIPKSALVATILSSGLEDFANQLQRDAQTAAL